MALSGDQNLLSLTQTCPHSLAASSLALPPHDWLPLLSAARTVGFWPLEWLLFMHPGFLQLELPDVANQTPPTAQASLLGTRIYLGVLYGVSNPTCRAAQAMYAGV